MTRGKRTVEIARHVAKLPDEVSESKVAQMVRRTIAGGMFLALGVLLLWWAHRMFEVKQEFSLPLIIGGAGSWLAAAHTWSGQIVNGTLRASLTFYKAFKKAAKEEPHA